MSPGNDVAAAAMNGVEAVASWLTPAVLFCVLNVMIGTIFFRSSLKPAQESGDDRPQPPRLDRVSSFLERVKAYNLSSYQTPVAVPAEVTAREGGDLHHAAVIKSDAAVANIFHLSSNYQAPQPAPAAREQVDPHHAAGDDLDAVAEEFELDSYEPPQAEEAAREPEPEPELEFEEPHQHVARTKSDAVVKAAPAVRALLKSASERISLEKEEEDEEKWRPATVRERTAAEDEEVDEKADDFINKFRQQLKLQRMDSILRSDEMLNRGAGRWR